MNDTKNVNLFWGYTIGCLARVTFRLICDSLTLLLLQGSCTAFFGWIVQVEDNGVRTRLDSSGVLRVRQYSYRPRVAFCRTAVDINVYFHKVDGDIIATL